MSKEAKVFRNGQMFNPEAMIPAVFPYEGLNIVLFHRCSIKIFLSFKDFITFYFSRKVGPSK